MARKATPGLQKSEKASGQMKQLSERARAKKYETTAEISERTRTERSEGRDLEPKIQRD